jgi:hypothetical protein
MLMGSGQDQYHRKATSDFKASAIPAKHLTSLPPFRQSQSVPTVDPSWVSAALESNWRLKKPPSYPSNVINKRLTPRISLRIIDLSTTMTKINERRHMPLCDRLIDLLRPARRESGPVIDLKNPEDETARLQWVTVIRWRRNALRHSFYSYRVAITGDIPLVSIESGNAVQIAR